MEDMSDVVNKFSEILKEKNIDLNDENSYVERNFTGHINQEEMQVSTFR